MPLVIALLALIASCLLFGPPATLAILGVIAVAAGALWSVMLALAFPARALFLAIGTLMLAGFISIH